MNYPVISPPNRQSLFRRLGGIALLALVSALLVWRLPASDHRQAHNTSASLTGTPVQNWQQMAGSRSARVVYARPPHLIILDLASGQRRTLANIRVAGGSGRRQRGKTPRPQWHPDGRRFLYRHAGKLYVADLEGRVRGIAHPRMNIADETRWSWWATGSKAWVLGPDREGHALVVDPRDPQQARWLYRGGDIKRWCELTGSGRYLVFWDGRDVRLAEVAPIGSGTPGTHSRRISSGQACRPAASPDDRVAWLPAPHTRYEVLDARTGQPQPPIPAPPGEEIYRLNWSNDPDYVVHMYGSEGNTRMHVRRLSSGQYLYIGDGWDPDLWIEE